MRFLKILFVIFICFPLCQVKCKKSTGVSQRPVAYIFSHGFGGNINQAKYYQPICPGPVMAFNYPEVTEKKGWFGKINVKNVSLGQVGDIEALARTYNECCKNLPDHDVVIVGVSRGASVAINFCATHRPRRVKALVLESPFASIPTLLEHRAEKSFKERCWAFGVRTMLRCACKGYHPKGPNPLHLAKLLPPNLPILIIGTPGDDIVPYKNTLLLLDALKTYHTNNAIQFLKLTTGRHGGLIITSDRNTYLHTVHSFYKKHGLPYVSEYVATDVSLESQSQSAPAA